MNDGPSAVLFGSLADLARDYGEHTALEVRGERTTFSELFAQCRELESLLGGTARRRVAVMLPASRTWVASLAALDQLGAAVVLAPPALDALGLEQLAATFDLDYVLRGDETTVRLEALRPSPSDHDETRATVTVLTSGTTGAAKGAEHQWASLRRPVRVDPRFVGTRWLLTNPPNVYAGLQVFLQCFLNAGTLVILRGDLGPREMCEAMLEARIQYVSATPSYWRRLLSFGSVELLRRLDLRQITLGGEPVPAELLRDLRGLFPNVHLSHIYATSELGRCFTVTDGHAGFPARYLEECPDPGVRLRVVDGELQAQSPNRMQRYALDARVDPDDWLATGDLVEVVGDRVLFRGRKSDVINVGGNKVRPLEVEAVLRQVHGVVDARVHPIASSIVGEMVAAEVVVASGSDTDALRREVARHCAAVLLPHQRPRQLTFVADLELTMAGKVSRRGPTP
jgi:acyl-CoA synthetase (AMP-forming)/AMP-acid ligase II